MSSERILVIGDSHSFFWTGRDDFSSPDSAYDTMDILHVGPVTAFQSAKVRLPAESHQSIDEWLDIHAVRYGCFMFCFGEIDCRTQIIKQSIAAKQPIEDTVRQTVDRYFDFILGLQEKYNKPCLIWGPCVSADTKVHYDLAYPAVGSCLERNYATQVFNTLCDEVSQAHTGIDFFTIFPELIDSHLNPRTEFTWDGIHLSSAARPSAHRELERILRRNNLAHLMPTVPNSWRVVKKARLKNVAAGKGYRISSELDGLKAAPFLEEDPGTIAFHTRMEMNPSIVIDLGNAHVIDSLEVFNSAIHPERAADLKISASLNGVEYMPIKDLIRSSALVKKGRIKVAADLKTPVRYVRLELKGVNFFHLNCVKVFGWSYEAA